MDSSKKEDKKDKEAKEESNKNNETQEKDNSDKKNEEEEFLKLIHDNQNDYQNDSNEPSFKVSFALKNPPVSEGQSFCISNIQNIGQNDTQFTSDSLKTENMTQTQRTLNIIISQNKDNK